MEDNLKINGTLMFDDSKDDIMGVPQSVVVRNDTVFAIDSYKSPGFFLFDKSGNQFLSYCSKGEGPEDIMSLFTLNVGMDELSAFDFGLKRLIFIDKKGNFLGKINMPAEALNGVRDNSGGIWTDYSNQEYEDCRLSWRKDSLADEKTVLTVPEHLKGMTMVSLQSFFFTDNGELRYLPVFEPVIYNLKDGNAKAIYELDFKGLWPDKEIVSEKFQGDDWTLKVKDFPVKRIGAFEGQLILEGLKSILVNLMLPVT